MIVMNVKNAGKLFFVLLCTLWLVPVLYSNAYLFPYVTPKALFFRAVVELMLPLYVFLLIADKSLRPNLKSPLNAALLAFFAVNLLSSLVGVNFSHSFWGDYERMGGVWHLGHLTLLYFYVLLLAKLNGAYLQRFLQVGLLVSAFTVFYGLWQKAGLTGYNPDFALPDRVSSSFGNPIFFASFLMLPLSLSVFLGLQEAGKKKFFYYAISLLCLIGIYISVTRGAFVGLVFGFLFGAALYLYKAKSKIKKWGIFGSAILLVFLTLVAVNYERLPEGWALKRIFNLQDSNSKSRLIQWGMAARGITERPLLGTGPENYYIIANKYQPAELYQYDRGWFDKPHNYWLEILATTGIVGTLVFVALAWFTAAAFWRAYKAELLSWGEFCLLVGALVAYHVQSLFLFETISSSLAFFAFTGFAGYLWAESSTGKAEKAKVRPQGLALLVVTTLLVVVIYSVYVTVLGIGRVLTDLNIANAADIRDPKTAYDNYLKVRNHPFVFDRGQVAVRFSNFAAKMVIASSEGKSDKEFINRVIDDAIIYLGEVANKKNDNPVFLSNLADLYLKKASFNQSRPDPKAETAVRRAMELAPNRVEPRYVLAEFYYRQGKRDEANAIIEQAYHMAPNIPDSKWRVAQMYKKTGKVPEAVKLAEEAFDDGYQLKLPQEALWLYDQYVEKKDYPKLIELLKRMIKVDSRNIDWYTRLAASYAANRQKNEAIETAKQILDFSPESESDVNAFINSL